MRRTVITAGAVAALGTGLLAGPPAAATNTACTAIGPDCRQPKVVSVTASKSAMTLTERTPGYKGATVRVTAVFDDPDDLLHHATFDAGVLGHDHGDVYRSTTSGTRKTFVHDVLERSDVGAPGTRTITVTGLTHSAYPAVTGLVPPTRKVSYLVRHKPEIIAFASGSMSTINREKVRFVGGLEFTTADANKKITVAFKKKGTKKFKKRQVVRTDADGQFRTKRFRIKTQGVWRLSSPKKGHVLKAKPDTFAAKRYF